MSEGNEKMTLTEGQKGMVLSEAVNLKKMLGDKTLAEYAQEIMDAVSVIEQSGNKVPAPKRPCLEGECWIIRAEADYQTFWFSRYFNGRAGEVYRPASRAEALVWAASIIQGYQPPRGLVRLDTPVDQTQPGPDPARAA